MNRLVIAAVTLGTAGCASLLGISEEQELALVKLEPSAGTLEPAFDPAIREYDLTVGFDDEQLVLDLDSSSADSAIRINDQSEPQSIFVPVGDAELSIDLETSLGVATRYTVHVHRADLGVAFKLPVVVNGIGMTAKLSIADFGGGPAPDFAFINTNGEIGVVMNDGAGRFALAQSYPFAATAAVTARDVDGDGRPDMIVSAGQVWYMHNLGDGTFDAGFGRGATQNPGALAFAQLDAGGQIDLVTPDRDGLQMMFGLGGGDFMMGPATPMATAGGEPRFVLAGRFDAAAGDDIATLNTATRTLSVLHFQPNRTFMVNPVTLPPNTQPAALISADFNNDQQDDLAWFDPMNRQVGVLSLGSAPVVVGVPLAPRALAAGDLDADGFVDLVVLDADGILVLHNSGKKTFASKRYAAFPPSTLLEVADFDGDGRADIVLGSPTDVINVFLGRVP